MRGLTERHLSGRRAHWLRTTEKKLPVPQLTGMHEPPLRTKAELMQELHEPSALAAEHSSGMQIALLNNLFPEGQTGPEVDRALGLHDPLTAGLPFWQVRQLPEKGSNAPQEGSTLLQVPL